MAAPPKERESMFDADSDITTLLASYLADRTKPQPACDRHINRGIHQLICACTSESQIHTGTTGTPLLQSHISVR